jgi:putative PIN family toxin of toxin-antitoxin system
VADINVLVAAAISPRGVCGRLVDTAIDGRWRPVTSPQLVAELEAVLARDKFRRWLSPEEAHRFIVDMQAISDQVSDPPASPTRVTADPKDEFLVALARAANVMALVSGDPHLTELVNPDPPVMTPAAFLNHLEG